MNRNSITKGLIWTFISVPSFCVLCLGSFVTLFYTETGKYYMLKEVTRFIEKKTNLAVRIDGLEGDIISDFKIREIHLYQGNEHVVSVKNLKVSWFSRDLLDLKIHINDLSIDDLSINDIAIFKKTTSANQSNKKFNIPLEIEHYLIKNMSFNHYKVKVSGRLKSNCIYFDGLDLKLDNGRILGKGYYSDDDFQLKAKIKKLSTDFYKIDNFPIKQGIINGEFEASGSIADPQIKANIILEGVADFNKKNKNIKNFETKILASGELINKQLSAQVSILNQANTVGSLLFKAPGLRFPLNINFNFELEPIMSLLSFPSHRLEGEMQGDLVVTGTYIQPKIQGDFKVKNGEYEYLEQNIKLSNIVLEGLLPDANSVEINKFYAKVGDGELEGYGMYSKLQQSFLLTLKNIAIKNSLMDGKAVFKGTFEDPDFQFDLKFRELYAYNQFNDKEHINVDVKNKIKDQVITVDAGIRSDDLSIGDIKFNSNWKRLRNRDDIFSTLGEAYFDVELSSLATLFKLENQKISGPLKGNLTLSGDILSPNFNGKLSLVNGQYRYDKVGIIIEDIMLNATADDKKINIISLTAKDHKKGRVRLSGYMDLENTMPYLFLKGDLKKMHLINTAKMSGDLNGGLALSGALNKLNLSGDLKLTPLDIDFGRNKFSKIPEIKVITKEAYHKQFARQSISPPTIIDFNLNIKAPKRIFISGNGLDAELEGVLKIAGNSQKPIIEGSLNTIRGQYEFLNKKFKITSGKVWIERNKIILDITATAKSSNLLATVNIHGATDDIQFSMTSNPSLPQDEIIARILFGRDIKKLSPLQAIQLANALSKLSRDHNNSIDLDLLGKTKKLLQLDSFNVDANEKSEVTVGVGKYLTDDAYLQLQQGTTTQETQASVEIELTPSISLETTTTSADSMVGDIKIIWRHDY